MAFDPRLKSQLSILDPRFAWHSNRALEVSLRANENAGGDVVSPCAFAPN